MKKQKDNPSFLKALLNSLLSFASLLPTIIAVIGIVAIFQTYVTADMLARFFGHGTILDILNATLLGAVSSGNGAISYVVADGLETQGVSDYALIAFIMAWVTLSLTHLPAEASVFGMRFTVYRNILTFISTILLAYLATITASMFI
ncbi:MAG TPA: permease [Sulfurovum sp.]|nr:permease [Sulfurovum sp.]